MAYEIRIRGHKEPIIVEENAERLRSDWENYQVNKKDAVVEVDGWVGRLSLINDFQRVKTTSAENTSNSHEEYLADRKKILDMSLEDRAKRMGYFRLVYKGFTGKNSEDVLINGIPIEKLIETEQLKFFTANPKAINCDALVFRKYIKSDKCNRFAFGPIEQITRQEFFARNNL